ncbi:NnrU family protein [Kiloniella antarctica]|uniref:NnrU family protein n=1 Tax=Kiloniella antarctica TaxID=1550907 RepID=A0ABW5BNP1_9PROT
MFGGFGNLIAAFVLFLLLHSIPPMESVKGSLIAALGKKGYYIGYSVISLAVLVWLIQEVWAAPYVEVWPYESWAARTTAHIMPLASIIFIAGFLRPNPLSIGSTHGFNKDRQGFVGIVRHPALWGFALWAGAHLFANGNLAEVLFFGGLLALSLVGMLIVDRRKKRVLGTEAWKNLSRGTSNIPLLGLFKGGNCRPTLKDGYSLFVGFMVFAVAIYLHPILFGVSPLSGFY